MALRATKIDATTVELDLNDYDGKTVNLTVNWSTGGDEIASFYYNLGSGEKLISSSSYSFTTDVAGGETYTFTHASSLNDPDQDIRIDSPSGTTVSWGFEDGGGLGGDADGGEGTDADYNDGVISITINSVYAGSESVTEGPGPKPAPSDWLPSILTCATPPTPSSKNSGLQISKSEDSDSSVVLNLKNFANTLVTLKVVHEEDASWQNGFSFKKLQASNILDEEFPSGGWVYDRTGAEGEVSNPDTSGKTTFYLRNLDGGDYDYIFTHSSVPGPVSTRTNYKEQCEITRAPDITYENGIPITTDIITTTCDWEPYEETYEDVGGDWPPCPVGVALTQNGGKEVKWYYEDGAGGAGDQTVTITVESVYAGKEYVTEGPGPKPAPSDWFPSILACATPPSLVKNLTTGLQIKKSGNSSVALNLKNYANKLVTLKVVHEEDAGWQNGFSFNIPQASDILVGGSPLGGSPYNRPGFSNPDTSGKTTFYLCNLDGGDYDYIFTHSSVPDVIPTRTIYKEQCTTGLPTPETIIDNDGIEITTDVITTTCEWVGEQETYEGDWPSCFIGVALTQNGGDEVRWVYEDGGGGGDDQIVTITVIDVRDAIPQSGEICMTDIKDQVWIADPANGSANGNCLSEYKNYSEQSRFRIPSIRSSITLPDPLCFTDFRGVAGAKTPSDLGLPPQ